MIRPRTLLVTSLLVGCLLGCANDQEVSDLEFQLRKVEGERDDALQRLAGEEARAVALQKRMET